MLVNKKTEELIRAFISKPTSSLIIEGSENSGAHEVVRDLTSSLLSQSHKNNIIRCAPETGKIIGVDRIRELRKSLMTTVGGKGIGRVAIVENAEKMTKEAQNSLLKILEEPTKNTVIILVTAHSGSLLETIRSRCQVVKVLPVTNEEAAAYAESKKIPEDVWKRAYSLSGGEPGLFTSLLAGKTTEITDQVERAKIFLSASQFERLALQKEYAKVEALESLLKGLATICEAALHSTKQDGVLRWKTLLSETKECQRRLSRNTPTKLIYLKLCVNL